VDQAIRSSEGYAIQRVNEAKGDTAKFIALLSEYEKAPEVTKRRLYLETMRQVLPRIENKIVIDTKVASVLPLLPLSTAKGIE
jgi:membrane protease subunit HflK|tara:strand:+ start:2878 stop:3126 length:249 start_codon:yes stop_codon:yes gene_type:complete